MGAAATVSKDDDETPHGQKTPTSLKTHDRNKTAAMVICSACKTPLGIFKRKVGLLKFLLL